MKWLIALCLVLVAGLVGVVVTHDRAGGGTDGAKIATISTGQKVDIDAQLRDGIWTVVEFTADW